jgi:hypothetical protein
MGGARFNNARLLIGNRFVTANIDAILLTQRRAGLKFAVIKSKIFAAPSHAPGRASADSA